MYYELNEAEARRAHEMNSFREFRSDEPEYREAIDDAFALARKAAEKRPAIANEAYSLADRYARKLAEWYNEGYRIDAMCPSVMVSGPANFPTKKKEVQNSRLDKHYGEYAKIEKMHRLLVDYASGKRAVKASDSDALEQLKAKLEAMEESQDAMKKANAYYRKHGNLDGYDGPHADEARESLVENASWFGGEPKPYFPYALSNNNANIKRVKERIAEIEAMRNAPSEDAETEIMGECVTIERDGEDARLRLRFDGKPSEETRAELKRNGFRWSPKNTAWQRQLNANGERALKRLLEA